MGDNKAVSVLIAVAVFAGACYGGWILTGWLSGLCWVVAFCAFGGIFMAAESKPCPACGKKAHASKGRIEHCTHCREWVAHVSDGTYVQVFGAEIPDEFRWPEGCCVCGAAATRAIRVSATKSELLKNLGKSAAMYAAAGSVRVNTGGDTTYSLDVPHCDEHDDGAYIKVGTLAEPAVMFRSESYRDAFCAVNDTDERVPLGASAKEPAPEPVTADA